MSRLGDFSPLNLRYVARLKEILTQHSYDSDMLGNIRTDVWHMPALETKYREALPSNTLIKLFLIGSDVDDFEVSHLFDPEEKLAFQELGLIEQVDTNVWRGVIRLLPYEKSILCCDFLHRSGDRIQRVYEPGPDSSNLAKAKLRLPFDTALDLCTGSGIQAVLSAQHCNYVRAVDINPRAVRFAAMSLAISGLANAEIRLADLYEGIEGKKFDLITANPPFVINYKATQQFRDGGKHGDEVLWRILHGLPSHLNDGGFAQIVTFLHEFEDHSQLEQVRAFAETHQLETIVFTSPNFDKYQLALGQHLHELFSSKDRRTFVEYREQLDRLKLISCCLAVITFKNSGIYRVKRCCALDRADYCGADLQEHLQKFYDL
jgi:methylase of polypeptide subunit release factors